MYQQLQTVLSHLRTMWLYRWLTLASAAVICAAGWVAVLALPNEYEVTANVHIDTRSALAPMLHGLVIGDSTLADTVALMRRTLFTRPNLEELARRTDLDLKAKSPKEMDDLLNKLGKRLSIIQERGSDIYQLRYVDNDPRVAKKVVDELLNVFLEGALGDTRQDKAKAQQFVEQQIAEYEQRLAEAEARVKEFKAKNMGLMPGESGSYFAKMQATQQQLEDVKLELKEAERRREELARQVEEAKNSVTAAPAGDDELMFFGGDLPAEATSPEIMQLDARLAAMQQRIDELLVNYTEKHPDVISIRSTMAQLEKQREEKIKEAAALAAQMPAVDPIARSPADNPIYQQTRIALAEAEANVAALKSRVEEYTERVKKLNELVTTGLEVEAEYQRLDRDYGINKQRYTELLERRESARLGEEAAETSNPVKIKVIEPPRLPIAPSGPQRLLLLSGVFVVSLGVGLLIAFLFSQLHPRIFTRQELKELTGLPVLGAVSLVRSPIQRSERRMELAMFSLVFLILLGCYGALVTLHLMNIDVSQYVIRAVGVLA